MSFSMAWFTNTHHLLVRQVIN
ncbi:hypothetical protein NC653_008117 [Populus alba x Populus x berolinensis]|uniref:Uncharacterized protein n=1 Tax=Populus alba x Populus x berolinensis TaxID=444605 RepID=A0AAD6R5Z2_9ROSI|nr:hypothetical protein NC653_008117 [Populus alba x Populus x berolinensis]